MIFEQQRGGEASSNASSNMAYSPYLIPRPTEYSNSVLAAHPQPYIPGFTPYGGPTSGGLPSSILPKLQQTVARAPMTPAEVLAHHSAAFRPPLRGLEPEPDVHDDPKVELEGKDLWEAFHKCGTEMVITKSGRYVHYSCQCCTF